MSGRCCVCNTFLKDGMSLCFDGKRYCEWDFVQTIRKDERAKLRKFLKEYKKSIKDNPVNLSYDDGMLKLIDVIERVYLGEEIAEKRKEAKK